ncbi:MAG: class I SAM-dependent methyltransferase [Clostridiales Family XIII bacterium]|jgi:hypothetical protein|nr:class I SAM-dependent methyltransferase [Clostridiales Family XIII bacterium]
MGHRDAGQPGGMPDRNTMFRQASEYTSFHKKLGVMIRPFLREEWDALDAGCGLGLLDLELAPCLRSIQAVDIDADKIRFLEDMIGGELARGHEHAARIEPQCADASALDGSWDVVIMSFFGGDQALTERLVGMARHRAVLIVHGRDSNGVFDPPPRRPGERLIADELDTLLKEKGFRFRRIDAEMQFGQPFQTIEGIHAFLDRLMSRKSLGTQETGVPKGGDGSLGCSGIESLIAGAEESIIRTNRYDYPYYLPRNMAVGVFVVVL